MLQWYLLLSAVAALSGPWSHPPTPLTGSGRSYG